MKTASFSFTFLGAGLALVFSGGYVLFGPMTFWTPDPKWAQVIFSPGIFVGTLTYLWLSHSLAVCYATGVATMTLIGGLIGAVLDLLIGPRNE